MDTAIKTFFSFNRPMLLASACFAITAAACNEIPSESGAAATVGTATINRQELLYRSAIQVAYSGDSLPLSTALVAAVNDALAGQVAAKLGLVPSDREVSSFITHIEQTTQAPEILRDVKNVFGNDTASWIRVYLTPKIVEANLQHYQAFDTAVQGAARAQIERAYSLAMEGKSFEEVARATGGTASIDTFTVQKGEETHTPEELAKYGIEKNAEHPLAALAREHLKPGVVFSQVVEDANAYRIVRLLDRNGERSIVETMAVPKSTYDTWLRSMAQSVPITLHDTTLANSVRKEYGAIWWVGRIPQN